MLTGKLVRVRHARNKLVPLYVNPRDPGLLAAAEQLLFAYRGAPGRTRGEIEADLADLVGDGPSQLLHEGLAKLLDDRCEYEVAADVPPDKVREAVFLRAAAGHAARTFDRAAVLAEVAGELGLTPDGIDHALFADLRDEQRVLKFADLTPDQLLNRYNVALAQAVVLRSTGMEVRVWNETPARFRQLFRAVKFHRLIGTIDRIEGNTCKMFFDGPLSLFSSTQKYGLQLALFLPALLHCKAFEVRADVRWGPQKKEKQFTLSGTDGLRTHTPDWGMYVPKEVAAFAENFRTTVRGWTLSDDPHPVPIEGTTWVPDFTLTHTRSGKEVHVEVIGFWRKVAVEAHYQRLRRAMPGRFVLVVSDQHRADDGAEFAAGPEVYRFKRTPIAEDVAKVAAAVAGV